jgi:hypothetical protein
VRSSVEQPDQSPTHQPNTSPDEQSPDTPDEQVRDTPNEQVRDTPNEQIRDTPDEQSPETADEQPATDEHPAEPTTDDSSESTDSTAESTDDSSESTDDTAESADDTAESADDTAESADEEYEGPHSKPVEKMNPEDVVREFFEHLSNGDNILYDLYHSKSELEKMPRKKLAMCSTWSISAGSFDRVRDEEDRVVLEFVQVLNGDHEKHQYDLRLDDGAWQIFDTEKV